MSIPAAAGWLLTILSAAALWVTAPGGWTLALALLTVLVPLLGILLTLPARRAVELDIRLPRAAEKGKKAVILLRGENTSLLPLPRVRCCCRLENGLTGETADCTAVLSLPPRGRGEAVLALESAQCGLFTIRLLRLEVCDPLGICHLPVKAACSLQLAVQPALFPMELLLPQRSGISRESDRYAPDRPGYDYSEPYQIREYVPGDGLRQIHWKLSSKMDKLIVRDPALPLEQAVLILWERGGSPTPRQSDVMAEVMATLCRELLEQGVSCRAAWDRGAGELVTFEAREKEEFYELLPQLLSASPSCGGETAAEMYCRLYGPENNTKVIFVGLAEAPPPAALCPEENLVSLLCGGGETGAGRVYSFDETHYAGMLAEIDLC